MFLLLGRDPLSRAIAVGPNWLAFESINNDFLSQFDMQSVPCQIRLNNI